jgi:protein-tyrosine kinase
MSRVEEALKRAGLSEDAPGRPSRRTADTFKTERQATSNATIADYPFESEPEEFPREVAVRQLTPRVSAPLTTARPELVAIPPAALTPVTAQALRRLNEAVQGKVVVDRETSAVSIEEYRRLAATLHGLQVRSKIKTLMISSALPGDGKTLTTMNLALTLSESYKLRVLVVDADLRRPSIHEVFNLPNDRGLAEGLRESSSRLPVIEVSPTLAVLTAGSPDHAPMAGLTSDRMKEVLEEASARFDWVLLDTPPIALISDAQLLAALVDGVILVVGAGSTDYRVVSSTVSQIGRERIVGVVLNRASVTSSASRYYHHYYHLDDSARTGLKP